MSDRLDFRPGMRIEVRRGSWSELCGVVLEPDGKEHVWVKLDDLTYRQRFPVGMLRPLDLLAPAGGAKLL